MRNKMNEDNMITVETFIFGGTCGNPYDVTNIDGFNGVTDPESIDCHTLATFTEEIDAIVSMYVWDTNDCIVVEDLKAEGVQTFQMPDATIITQWFDEYLQEK